MPQFSDHPWLGFVVFVKVRYMGQIDKIKFIRIRWEYLIWHNCKVDGLFSGKNIFNNFSSLKNIRIVTGHKLFIPRREFIFRSLALDTSQNKFRLRFLLPAHGELADNEGVNLGIDWQPLTRGFQISRDTHPPDHFVFLPLG